MSVHFSSDDHTWETPQGLFDNLNKTFKFTWDAAATLATCKCGSENYFGPDQKNESLRDALTARWYSHNCYWMNPPYGREIGKFMSKASVSDCRVVCLVPARTDTKWWYRYVHQRAATVGLIHGRLKFGGSKNSAPFPSAVVFYERHRSPGAEASYMMMSTAGDLL